MNNKDLTLNEQFARITRLLFRERLRSVQTGGTDDWRKRLLGLIKAHPGTTLKELSEMLNRRMTMGEELLLGLEKKGYVAMKPVDGSDDKIVELTELGLKEAAEYQGLGDALTVLNDDEKDILGGFLTRMIDALQKKDRANENPGSDLEEEWLAGFRDMGGPNAFQHMRKLHELFLLRKGPHGRYPYGCDPRTAFRG